MKHCPKCQREYNDDSLIFCLNDGAQLTPVSKATSAFDPDATLVLPENSTGSGSEAQQTGTPVGRTTNETPQPAQTTPMSASPAVTLNESASTQNRPNLVRVVALTVFATIFLLGLGGAVAWVLLRNNNGNQTSNSTQVNQNQSTGNSSGGINPKASPQPAVTPTSDKSGLQDQITSLLNGWVDSAKRRDIDAQMSYYADSVSPYYRQQRVKSSEIRADREKDYSTYSTINITLANVDIKQSDPDGDRATATFDKTWSYEGSSTFSGSAQQQLSFFKKKGGKFLITGEKNLQVYKLNKN